MTPQQNIKTVIEASDCITANAYLHKNWVILKILENGHFILGLNKEVESWEELLVSQ